MENYIVINGKRIDLSEEQIEKLGLKVEKKTPFDRNKNGEYFFVDCTGNVANFKDEDFLDEQMFKVGNYCRDKEIMIKRAKEEVLNRLLWRFSIENGGDKIDWQDDNQKKYYIFHIESNDEWLIYYHTRHVVSGSVYFIDVKVAKRAVTEIIRPFYAGELEVCKIWEL